MMRLHVLAVFSILLLACHSEQRRLQERMELLEGEQASRSRRVEETQSATRETGDRLDALKRELATYNTNIESFINAHHIAASCIRTARSTWGDNNSFSHVPSATTRFGTVLCGVALLNGQFAAEVAGVADQLTQADTHVRKLKEQIAATEQDLAADRSALDKSEAALRQIEGEIADVRQQMER